MSVAANRIILVHGHVQPRLDIRRALASRYDFQERSLRTLGELRPDESAVLVIDAPLDTKDQVAQLQDALNRLKNPEIGRAFVLADPGRGAVRASVLGPETIIARPIEPEQIYPTLNRKLAEARQRLWQHEFGKAAHGLDAGTQALERVFDLAANGALLTQAELGGHGESIVEALAQTGLVNWIEAVKAHHSRTFRHCLLVTGVLISFGQHLGLRRVDLERLAVGALLHDIGKARIPLDILEKPGALTDEERAIMKEHPGLGCRSLIANGSFSSEMLDIVGQHHELLDGSGYPDGLAGSQISDIVRLTTIADIFSALIEPRAYKPPMPNAKAYEILQQMDGKLDRHLVNAFEKVALQTRLIT